MLQTYPLKMNLALEIRVGLKIGESDPSAGLPLVPRWLHPCMVAPLNFVELDNLAVCDSAVKLENPHWFLLLGQIAIQLYRFQWHSISQRYLSHLCVALLQLRNMEHIVNS